MNRVKTSRWWRYITAWMWPSLVVLPLSVVLTSCFQEETKALPYLGVNHTDAWVPTFLINGEGGVLNVPPLGGGGGEVCCVTMPKRWRPNLMVTVKWRKQGHWLKDAQGKYVIQNGGRVLIEGGWVEQTVPVPEYTDRDLSHFDVHFLPGDKVQVKVSFIYPEHKDYLPRYPQQRPAQL
ncbi:MAG: hypothetical protein A3G29_00515 [Burkholderiales bacterium RIFCSPLOWO2_12_FULL_64_99]|jgi:hypothetical protein|uniref:DUF3304 domain-containing protein n=1 Tax=Aquabacterium sp. TaxID=1872578 RepID=UPI0008CA8756|nr:DUF3304 domain-containing protein [Aquabacterium sp.]OGB05564.1 MAG: hypothetical protein A3E52_01380 [Burkholderiales bacterium RIFCSPHIGHO2_12_FULL_63_20]OGB67502.1 MAG: hypothetical protein A3G29_00515 [Burkholderiales bacterium RIFCSPLOWO2_12_FULL_64_99]